MGKDLQNNEEQSVKFNISDPKAQKMLQSENGYKFNERLLKIYKKHFNLSKEAKEEQEELTK